MLSNRSSREDSRVKMREEAKKKRAQIARAAKLPHVQRNENKYCDPGFVSIKVPPAADDNLAVLLQNGLIDYRELLGTFPTREDYRYLGIDNVPGTPEVNIYSFDDAFGFPKQTHRVNGYKNGMVRESNSPTTRDNDDTSTAPPAKEETPSPASALQSNPKQESSRQNNATSKIPRQEAASPKRTTKVKEEPQSPKRDGENSKKEDSTFATRKNGEIGVKSKILPQQKSKPPVLKMPEASKSNSSSNEKTKKAHPNKIESIMKEMTELLPPLTDIQTPVKSQETRFPFPQVPPAKEISNHLPPPDKQTNQTKTDEIWTADLITTSDDESDEEAERGQRTEPEAVPGASKRRLSASSSSSSDGSSSDSSSDSESSDSEAETKVSSGRKAMKTPSSMFRSESSDVANASTPQSHNGRQPTLAPPARKTPKGKFMCGEVFEKQVSPLNSIAKEMRKEAEISPIPDIIHDVVTLLPETHLEPETHLGARHLLVSEPHLEPESHLNYPSLNSATANESNLQGNDISFKHKDNISNKLCTHNDLTMNQELTNPTSFPEDIMVGLFDHTEDFIQSEAQLDSFADIMNMERSPFDSSFPMIGMEDQDDTPAVSTVNTELLNFTSSAELDPNTTVHGDRTRGGKRPAMPSMTNSINERNEAGQMGNASLNNGRKQSSSTPLQSKPQSKKDKEQEWFMNILSPKKNFKLPYVNPDKLKIGGDAKETSTPVRPSVKSGPMKIRIPLSKIRQGKQNVDISVSSVAESPKKPPKVKGKDINSSTNRKKKNPDQEKRKMKAKSNSGTAKCEKPRQSCGKDIEQIKSLMAELSNKAGSDEEEVVDIIRTPSPLKSEARVSGKQMKEIPENAIAKKDLSYGNKPDNAETPIDKDRTKLDSSKKPSESLKSNARKRTSSSISQSESNYEPNPQLKSKKSKRIKDTSGKKKKSVSGSLVVERCEDSSLGIQTPNSVQSILPANNFLVKINLSQLRRVPGNKCEEKEEVQTPLKDEVKVEQNAEANHVPEMVWKPPPSIRIPKIVKSQEDETTPKGSRGCIEGLQDFMDTDSSSNCSSTCKQIKDSCKEKKMKRSMEGRGVKRKEWDRFPKNANPNVCGMCGSLQKDSGRDPIRLGAYKTSYIEYLGMGKRSKHIADCLDSSERAPKYIDAILKYIQYLVGLEITGKTGTKHGTEEYMCITSQCIDLVEYVITQYGKKENNNNTNYDVRFIYLCLRLQSVLYFKLFALKKESAARYSKLLSEYFKVHRSPHRVNIKGSTGTPSPMSPTSSHTGSVASFGSANSSISNGSYIQTDMFERMQQYFTYTRYLLHGHRLWDDADSLGTQCQEFVNTVSRRVGAINFQSSMLHLVDYISSGLDVIKDSENCVP